jgi:hypothetical protein
MNELLLIAARTTVPAIILPSPPPAWARCRGQGPQPAKPVRVAQLGRATPCPSILGQPCSDRRCCRLVRHSIVACTHCPVPHLISRALSSPAASTPQNLTSGRRSPPLAPKFLIPEVVGPGRRNHSLSRHLAARTLCGPPAEIRQRVSVPRG